MQHVKWNHPGRERDYEVHFLKDAEWTLCGNACEGEVMVKIDRSHEAQTQGFIATKEPVTCPTCIDIVLECKRVKSKEFKH